MSSEPLSTSKRDALVLSGGGALGAYEIGVMKALARGYSKSTNYEPLHPNVYTGTSVGAYNAAFLSAQANEVPFTEAVDRLEEVWLQIIANQGDGYGNGVFRYRANPFEFLNPYVVVRYPFRTLRHFIEDVFDLSQEALKRLEWFLDEAHESIPDRLASLFDLSAFISMTPLEETLKETIDYTRLGGSDNALWIAATNWTSGELDLSQGEEMTERRGPHLLKGTAAVPGIFPPEQIGEDWLVDGSVLMNTPLAPALEDRSNSIHVITLQPKIPYTSHRSLSSTIGAMSRATNFAWDFIVDTAFRNLDIACEILHDLEKVTSEVDKELHQNQSREAVLSILEKARGNAMEKLGLPPDQLVEIHRYRPCNHLYSGPLGMILFAREHIEATIDQGFADTCHHDCEENGCVLGPRS